MPDLKVVSERSAQEIKELEATARLKWALVDLIANIMRVMRGAGKPDEIPDHLNTLSEAMNSYTADVGRNPDGILLSVLIQIDWNGYDHHSGLTLDICRDALQIVASTLLKQSTPKSKAEAALWSNIRTFAEDFAEKRGT